ncbi:MAG: hypothetical protein COS89_00790 [Deltaproteobacteria bacterium CG07_land_8_20_14_0_80_38_7]|nr:MAG: hypothetical protein COS89_00790 [Deltaproteobacteria bacterium CG07_land_8_20_14_0_80_38_7]
MLFLLDSCLRRNDKKEQKAIATQSLGGRVRNLRRLKPAATKMLRFVTSATASQGRGNSDLGALSG